MGMGGHVQVRPCRWLVHELNLQSLVEGPGLSGVIKLHRLVGGSAYATVQAGLRLGLGRWGLVVEVEVPPH